MSYILLALLQGYGWCYLQGTEITKNRSHDQKIHPNMSDHSQELSVTPTSSIFHKSCFASPGWSESLPHDTVGRGPWRILPAYILPSVRKVENYFFKWSKIYARESHSDIILKVLNQEFLTTYAQNILFRFMQWFSCSGMYEGTCCKWQHALISHSVCKRNQRQ